MSAKKSSGDEKKGSSWFRMLPIEMEMITTDEMIEPEGRDVETNETAVATADLDIKKLYTLMIKTEEKATRTLVDARYERDHEKKQQLRTQAIAQKGKADVLREILFSVIRDTYNLWDENIGIRAGWLIVTYKEKNKKGDFRDFLKGIGLAPPDDEE